MLAKSQARMFFLVATLGFSGIFLGLTIDTIRQTPARSHDDQLTEEVVRGKEIWDKNNCMGCHTLLGEGAYYAPELTQVVDRRGAAWIDLFLQDPQKMFPGKRKMVQYDFSERDRKDVIAFLSWVGKIDTNGFPAKPDLALTSAAPVSASNAGAEPPKIFSSLCVSCHSLHGQGGVVGPALDGVGQRRDAAWLRTWLADPPAVKPGTAMPKIPLTPTDMDALVTFLSTQ